MISRGFSAIFIIIGVVFILVLLFVLQDIFLAPKDKQFILPELEKLLSSDERFGGSNQRSLTGTKEGWAAISRDCNKIDNLQFTADFTDLSVIDHITPLGTVAIGEIRTHTYINPKEKYQKMPLYAPTEMKLITGAFRNLFSKGQDEYALIFQISCDHFLKFDHISAPVEKIRAVFPDKPAETTHEQRLTEFVDVKAGELLGYTTGNSEGNNWDFGLYDIRHKNNFANMNRHKYSFRMLHGVCPYDYFPDKEKYYALFKNLNGEKINECGRASHDVPGTINGGWFLEGSKDKFRETRYLGVSEFLSPGSVRIVGFGSFEDEGYMVIDKNNKTYKNPTTVTTEHCYADDNGSVYFKLFSETKLGVYYQQGELCPEAFPQKGYNTFMR